MTESQTNDPQRAERNLNIETGVEGEKKGRRETYELQKRKSKRKGEVKEKERWKEGG